MKAKKEPWVIVGREVDGFTQMELDRLNPTNDFDIRGVLEQWGDVHALPINLKEVVASGTIIRGLNWADVHASDNYKVGK